MSASPPPSGGTTVEVAGLESPAVTDSPLVKRMLWSGLMATTGALATLLASRVSTLIWKRVFDEEPPE